MTTNKMNPKKKKYAKPTVKLAKWELNEAICQTVYEASPCIHVVDDFAGNTRIDHRQSTAPGGIEWQDWPGNTNR